MIGNFLWSLIEPVTTLFEVLICYMFFRDVLGLRKNIRKIYYTASFILFALALMALNQYLPIPRVTIIFTVLGLFALSLLFDSDLKSKAFAVFVFTALMIASEMLALFSILSLMKISVSAALQTGVNRLLGIIISKLILFVITRVICFNEKPEKARLGFKLFVNLLTTPLFSIIIMYTIFSYNSYLEKPGLRILSFISAVSALYISIMIFYLFNDIIDKTNVQAKYRLLKQQMEFQLRYYNDYEISQKEMRRFRHDVKNHLNCVSELLQSGDVKDAEAYLSSITGYINESGHVIASGNAIVDSILSAKLLEMKTKDIQFSYTIEIPANVKANSVDICIILGNALDNAIEACGRILKGEKKIKLLLVYKCNSLLFHLSNTTDGRVVRDSHSFFSSKRDYKEYGYGLSNIESAVEKYKGSFSTHYDGSLFDLSVMLYNV